MQPNKINKKKITPENKSLFSVSFHSNALFIR